MRAMLGASITAVLLAVSSLPVADVALAAATGARHVPVKPGSTWTFRLSGGPCEVVHFHASHRFTTGGFDAGTYRSDIPHLTMKWTAGPDFSTSFAGRFSARSGIYSGTWFDGDHIPATLRPGAHCA